MLHRRTVFLSAAALLPHGLTARADPGFVPSPRDKTDIARVEAYLNGLRSLKARFTQVAPDGGISDGTVWLARPGRMRFQYNPPSPILLVASHGVVVFHDSSLDQTTEVQLSRTPLGILLADRVDLTGSVTVTAIERVPGQLQITLVRSASPSDGSLTLIFADSPLLLRQWTVVDAQRKETHVTLYDGQTGGSFDPALFEPPAGSGAKD